MNLKRQLLLVSLFALLLPWAGCEFIRETESALRNVQQQMLAGTARALANTMAQYSEEYPQRQRGNLASEQLFLHQLSKAPNVDGYFDDWELPEGALRTLAGSEGPVRIAIASDDVSVYLYVEVSDRQLVYANAGTLVLDNGPNYADRVTLINYSPLYLDEAIVFAAEAPGAIISYRRHSNGFGPEAAIAAYWQDMPGGYRLEARLPADMLGTHLGIVVSNTSDEQQRATRVASFSGNRPQALVRPAKELQSIVASLVDPETRVILTDSAGWRIAMAGSPSNSSSVASSDKGWSRRIYGMLVESGEDYASAEPQPSGREREPYVSAALSGREMPAWFRGEGGGTAIVAVAAPIVANDEVVGALILQQGTDAILSLTNRNLVRLINLTLVVTLLVAGSLIAYASWLSRRIRTLSAATESALETETLQSALPSALAGDEIGDLSRSFSNVLRQLDNYNAYLRSLASKLSHELRTPLAIVTSSLENLEHEKLADSSAAYTARAREGADRLRRILSAMSEASRVEELMKNAEKDSFELHKVLQSTIDAYRDVYTERAFEYSSSADATRMRGSPELLIQMLDKLVSNAVDFSRTGDAIRIALHAEQDELRLSVANPGPALPLHMRAQMFDSMVSVRAGEDSRHLGLGLYIARLIAEGHGGSISADNTDDGVIFEISLPRQDSR